MGLCCGTLTIRVDVVVVEVQRLASVVHRELPGDGAALEVTFLHAGLDFTVQHLPRGEAACVSFLQLPSLLNYLSCHGPITKIGAAVVGW